VQPLVSILIPAFNAEAWIAESIESALVQSWPKKEIIIVDDGSKDGTYSIARQFASKEVLVLTQANQGAVAARNRAFSLSQGDYIQWLDADDLLAPDKIGKQMRAVEECGGPRTLLSCAWGHFVYRTSRARFRPTSLWCDLSPIDWLLRKFGGDLFMQPSTWLVSRDLTEAAGPWDTRLSLDDDGEYFCRVVRNSDGIRFVPGAKVFYRRAGFGSLSNPGRSGKKLESQFLSLQLQIRCLRSLEDSERVRLACLRFLEAYLTLFYPERPDIIKRAEELAVALGGRLPVPLLPWKYAWIKELFGWTAAKQAQLYYNRLKSSAIASWDRTMFHLGR
jgi:glycosyltransferase involved in cell wall biosynthesis